MTFVCLCFSLTPRGGGTGNTRRWCRRGFRRGGVHLESGSARAHGGGARQRRDLRYPSIILRVLASARPSTITPRLLAGHGVNHRELSRALPAIARSCVASAHVAAWSVCGAGAARLVEMEELLSEGEELEPTLKALAATQRRCVGRKPFNLSLSLSLSPCVFQARALKYVGCLARVLTTVTTIDRAETGFAYVFSSEHSTLARQPELSDAERHGGGDGREGGGGGTGPPLQLIKPPSRYREEPPPPPVALPSRQGEVEEGSQRGRRKPIFTSTSAFAGGIGGDGSTSKSCLLM